MNNVYREAFVFDCAKADRKFYLPKDGSMKLQFFHVRDLCRLMEVIINDNPSDHIFNVGNKDTISIKDWASMCYACLGKVPTFVNVYNDIEQRKYFSFYQYEYCLDVQRQNKIYPNTIPLDTGLKEAAVWYLENEAEVKKKPYFDYIDTNLA
ncbi:putative dTDP-glucose 4 6-dehydratase [Roseburia sp. CAG:100]|nr:putative dTDP-glucose 4 6-dehydratase [Roseburia sp. CAG:100]